MSTIEFIQQPSFAVDFKQFTVAGKQAEDQKTESVALVLLKLIPLIITSLTKASYVTMSHSGTSFKHIVLGFYGSWREFSPPADIYLAVFKVAFWALGLVWCTAKTAARLVSEELFPASSRFLANYAMRGIDVSHIRTKEIGIDVSEIAATVKVGDLAKIYSEINFTDKNSPGYMAPTSRQDINIETLKENLALFIKRVNERVAFLGTPPAYDTPRLMAFYQQIENAVRFSIDKSNRDIAAFKATNGGGPYQDASLKTYCDLLEDRARIAIDLAIAGGHCGARYMGEAMSVYANTRGDELIFLGSLQDSIVELLARKRYQIAVGQIEEHLHRQGVVDTHSYNKYMANLGNILGLPGTENIIEHLDTNFDRNKFLRLFFEKYTVDVIIATIQEEIKKKKSAHFRAQITDWIKDQPGEWMVAEYAAAAQGFEIEAKKVIDDPTYNPAVINAARFANVVNRLKDDKVALPPVDEDFVEKFFQLDAVVNGGAYENLHSFVRASKFTALKTICSSVDLDGLAPEAALDALVNAVTERSKSTQTEQNIALLKEFVQHLRDAKCALPEFKTWDDYITDVFTLEESKAWRTNKLGNQMQGYQKFNQLKALCSNPPPIDGDLAYLKTAKPHEQLAYLVSKSVNQARIDRVRSVVSLDDSTVIRSFENKDILSDAIKGKLNQERQSRFLDELKLEEFDKLGISPELMEWLTVSQGIFTAQEVGG